MPFAVGRLADEIGIIDSFGVVAPLLIGAILLTALDRRRAARVNEEEPGASKRVEDED